METILETVPPVVIGWVGPLLVIVPFVLVLKRWLGAPLRFGVLVYAASIISAIVIDVSMDVSDRESAIVAGVYAPVIYAFLFAGILFFYRYILWQGFDEHAEPTWLERLVLRAGGLVSGGLTGGVVGLLAGGVISYFLVTAIFLAPRIFDWRYRFIVSELVGKEETLIDIIIYTIGFIGLLVGGWWGQRVGSKKRASPNPRD